MLKALQSLLLAMLATLALTGCAARPGTELRREGDEIVVAGRLFHTGAPVVLWTDPGGYDAYRVERRFVPFQDAGWEKTKESINEPARYNLRYQRKAEEAYSPEELERVRGGGWELDLLRSKVDQFVLHYDVCGTSRTCFRVLHDMRGLSIHFMLDIDGTIYQTLDLKERAWHATISNDRSIGIEIANIGAYPEGKTKPLDEWYVPEVGKDGAVRRARVTIPARFGDGGVRTPGFVGYSARPTPVTGEVQGSTLIMYDLTPQQYDSLVKLTAALCRIFPQIEPRYPTDQSGSLIPRQLSTDDWKNFKGVLGHFHIQDDKTDPGPAFNWPEYMARVRRELSR
jgi:N-acetylmuramoyl-L-alanine amidase